MSIRYLLDENLPLTFHEQLLLCQPDLIVWMVGDLDAPLKGTLDPEILCWCEEQGFILGTRNLKFVVSAEALRQGFSRLKPLLQTNNIDYILL
ncbi:DUF5615 family PIN-like protein [Iningainema tapete]|uniref:DUF5615 family PIN-like protein n=1 Tax=Iningainema tapete BLCC-T55 TaxID=2748662 RepID=A0A8J6XDW0_9CYAN|nr:DUF5615 family PIN-like protein [Iningainema tapete]MBD2773589.1 DUF5615 family PIN-like protein [Iningainema tapete BLCC-T55]